MNKENYTKIINLLDQLIAYNEYKDSERQKESDTGESFNIFHLKLLKSLIEDGKE